jgi:hypothetical protein
MLNGVLFKTNAVLFILCFLGDAAYLSNEISLKHDDFLRRSTFPESLHITSNTGNYVTVT